MLRFLRPSREKHDDQNNDYDTANPDPTIRSESVVTAATAKQQEQDQDQ
jgi:hypothetical protein